MKALAIPLATVLFSIPGYISVRGFEFDNGPISVDILIAALLLGYVRRPAARFGLTFLVIAAVLVDLVTYMPPGVALLDVFETGLKSALSLGYVKLVVVAALVCSALAFSTVSLAHVARRAASPTMIFTLLALTSALALAQSALKAAGAPVKLFRSGGTATVSILLREPKMLWIKLSLIEDALKPEAGLSAVAQPLKAADKLLVIMVESLGVPTQRAELFRSEIAMLRSAGCERPVEATTVRSADYTIQSEVRQLCSSRMHSFRADLSGLQCAPKVARSPTFAYHNNTLDFYSRGTVYKEMGFGKIYDLNEMGFAHDPAVPFRGASDSRVAEYIARNAKLHAGVHYWMTLDLHSPYDARSRGMSGSSLENYLALRARTMTVLQRLISQLPDYEVIVMGDHPPKFFGPDDAAFEKRRVPYIRLSGCSTEQRVAAD